MRSEKQGGEESSTETEKQGKCRLFEWSLARKLRFQSLQLTFFWGEGVSHEMCLWEMGDVQDVPLKMDG